MKFKLLLCGFLALGISTVLLAEPSADQRSTALKNAVILVIRHAEKPASGFGLSAEGKARATAYVNYLKHFTIDGQPLKLDYIFAAADSKESHRPRLTVEPASQAFGLAINTRFKDKDFQNLADEIRARPHGKAILIVWHHAEIPPLLRALGADPAQIIPNAKWPGEVFGWLIELRYNERGQLTESRLINENLLPDDADKHAKQ